MGDTDLNEIFGYKVYKPPKEELPVVPELNIAGEILTMIDPNADVIEDATVQALLETMDGERTVKVEDLAPDMRYDVWTRRVEFDDKVIKNRTSQDNLRAKDPVVNQTLLPASGEPHKPFSLSTARPEVAELVAQQRRQQELAQQQFQIKQQQIAEQQRLIEEKKQALLAQQQELQYKKQLQYQQQQNQLQNQQSQQYQQQAILYQIKQQQLLAAKSGNQVATPEQQAIIQKLLLDLAKINPQLALETLQQFKQNPGGGQQQQQQQQYVAAAPAPRAAAVAQPTAKPINVPEPANLKLVHSMGSIHPSEPTEFTQAPPAAVKPRPK